MPGLIMASTAHDEKAAMVAGEIAESLTSADGAVEACDFARCTVEVYDVAGSKREQSVEDYDRVIASEPLQR